MKFSPLAVALLASSLCAKAHAACDEPDSKEDPLDAKDDYEANNMRYPLFAVGSCTDSQDGYPASGARPKLWENEMFGGDPNFNQHDLPVTTTILDKDGRPTDVYETLHVRQTNLDVFGPHLQPGQDCKPEGYAYTPFLTYGSASVPGFTPGPTVKVCEGRMTMLRFENELTPGDTPYVPFQGRPFSVHLHGSGSVAPYDGWADDETFPEEAKHYIYPNERSSTLWYHDHAVGITADNAYDGMAAEYIVKDCNSVNENYILPLEKYSIPWVIRDAVLVPEVLPDGNMPLLYQGGKLNLSNNDAHKDWLFGDINVVNGVAWPRLTVQRLSYRLRGLNPSISRTYNVKFLATSSTGYQAWVPFYALQSDGGGLLEARKLYSIYHQVAERYELLISFDTESKVFPELPDGEGEWEYVYAVNDFGPSGKQPPLFCKSHLLARFDLADGPAPAADLMLVDKYFKEVGDAPAILPFPQRPFEGLRNLVPQEYIDNAIQRAMQGDYDRQFDFGRHNGQWTINNCLWEDEACRIIANPSRDGLELWKFKGHGGWYHPIHLHLVDFLVIRRDGGDKDLWEDYNALTGDVAPFFTLPGSNPEAPWSPYELRPWEWQAPKDVVHLGSGQDVWVITRFGANDGDFMFHCHNLVHEDSDMMAAFGVGRAFVASKDDPFSAEAQGQTANGEYYFTVDAGLANGGKVDGHNLWVADVNELGGQLTSPYNPQFPEGQPDVQLRDAMGDPARPISQDDRFDENGITSEYACERACRGIYDTYYPSPDVLDYQLSESIGWTPENPIFTNVWATFWIEYENMSLDALINDEANPSGDIPRDPQMIDLLEALAQQHQGTALAEAALAIPTVKTSLGGPAIADYVTITPGYSTIKCDCDAAV